MPLNVIGTGSGRTGTDFMRNALNMPGVGPAHHLFELGEGARIRQPWCDMVNCAAPDWEALFAAIAICNRNVADVLATVDPDRLLVHNLGAGWEPLCAWPGVPVPDVDYLGGNTSEDFVRGLGDQGVDI